jgi:hypothetical protein
MFQIWSKQTTFMAINETWNIPSKKQRCQQTIHDIQFHSLNAARRGGPECHHQNENSYWRVLPSETWRLIVHWKWIVVSEEHIDFLLQGKTSWERRQPENRWQGIVPPKRLLAFDGLHGVISHTTAVRTWDRTQCLYCLTVLWQAHQMLWMKRGGLSAAHAVARCGAWMGGHNGPAQHP